MRAFLLKFSVVLIALFCAEISAWAQDLFVSPWTVFLAKVSAAAARLFYPDTVSSGLAMVNTSNGFGVVIAPGCNGIEAIIVLAAAIVAFPSRSVHKAVGLALGFVAVQMANLVRI